MSAGVRVLRFCLAPLVDHWPGPSITRVLAIWFAGLDGYVIITTRAITLNALWLALASLAAAFGKSTFTFLLQRIQSTTSVTETRTETHTVDEKITREIKERRDPIDGTEPAL